MESQPTDLEEMTKGIWQWKSNQNPWSQTEESKWESYSLKDDYLIEKAYHDGQKEVAIGDYIIYPKDQLQIRKGNPYAQRPIRRISWMEDVEMNERSHRYFETEPPKTINKVFGLVEHFISFFKNRNPKILKFIKDFREYRRKNNLYGLGWMVKKLVASLKRELMEPIKKQLKQIDSAKSVIKMNVLKKMNERHKELIASFQRKFSSFEDFDMQILKAYTMNTSLYVNLNQYLRNEDWSGMNNLLPYAFCFCEAFYMPFTFGKDNDLLDVENQESMLLYRGTAFDDFAFSSYDKNEVQHFGWNSVTSTTIDKKTAEDFMYKSTNLTKKKYPVMFIIEVPARNRSAGTDYLRWMQVHPFSVLPKESEVLLPPGSVFKLEEVSRDQDKKITIKLKLKEEIHDWFEGSLTLGAYLDANSGTKMAKFQNLNEEQVYEALKCLSGNQLIESVDFDSCGFGQKSLCKLREILPTLKSVKYLAFKACSNQEKEELLNLIPKKIQCSCDASKIEVSQNEDFCHILAQCFHICRKQNDFVLLEVDDTFLLGIIAKNKILEIKSETVSIWRKGVEVKAKKRFIKVSTAKQCEHPSP